MCPKTATLTFALENGENMRVEVEDFTLLEQKNNVVTISSVAKLEIEWEKSFAFRCGSLADRTLIASK